jgi:putative nucleotidyltransferase with HDIG domain
MSVVEDTADGPARYLPHAIAATAAMTLAPAAAVWGLALSGVATAFIPLLAVGLVVSLLVAYGGRVVWQMQPGSRDLLFSDLMLWGWLRRWRLEKHLRDAGALLGLNPRAVLERGDELDPETRTKALEKLVTALEARDPYTHGHSRRVARYSTMIAKKLGLPASDVARIRLAATLHDVGKLVVRPAILNKPGSLNEVEFALIKRHAPVGADMVSPLGDDELTRIVAHHHERLDGTGYPSQLSGGEIPLGARIIAVADTFDALTSNRVYKPAKRHRDAFWILGEEMGTQLDPVVVQAFRRSYSGFRGIAAWSIVTGAPQRVLLPLAIQAPIAGGTLSAKTLAVLAAAAATVSASSPNVPRDTSASPSAVPALAAVGALAQSVEPPSATGRSAESPARGHRQGESQSNGRRGGRAGADGTGGDRPGQGGGPSPGGEPEPVPDPGNPPGPDAPPLLGGPGGTVGQLVTERLERLREQSGHLQGQSVRPPEPPGQLVEHPGAPRVAVNGPRSRLTRTPAPRPPRKP